MAKRDMKKALGASLKAEEQAVKSRFEKAKTVLGEKAPVVPREQPPPEEAGSQVIRDSFTIPDGDDELISRIRRRCLKAGISINKSEVLRAGLAALDAMPDRKLKRLFKNVRRVKTGGPRHGIRIFIIRRTNAVKFWRPLQIKRFQFARKVIIGHRTVTIMVGKFNLMNL